MTALATSESLGLRVGTRCPLQCDSQHLDDCAPHSAHSPSLLWDHQHGAGLEQCAGRGVKVVAIAALAIPWALPKLLGVVRYREQPEGGLVRGSPLVQQAGLGDAWDPTMILPQGVDLGALQQSQLRRKALAARSSVVGAA